MKKRTAKKSGMTLVEIILVVATIVVLVGLAIPAVRAFVDAFQSEASAVSMISSALASSRAMALKHQRYVGIRFQTVCNSDNIAEPFKAILEAQQYMIFIIHEEPTKMNNLTIGFTTIQGLKPIKLPHTVTVIDFSEIASDEDIDELVELNDATAFSILFSPSGKLILHDVRVRNKNGVYQPNNDDISDAKHSTDDVFNSDYNIINYGIGMFIQDDYPDLGLERESSINHFIICEKQKLTKTFRASGLWSDYMMSLAANPYYISPYSGQAIKGR